MARKPKVVKETGGARSVHIREIVELYEGGMSTREVGEKLGLSTNVVGKWLRKAGVELRGGAKVYGLEEYLEGRDG